MVHIFSPMIYKITEANIEVRGFQIGEAIVGHGANADADCKHYVGKIEESNWSVQCVRSRRL